MLGARRAKLTDCYPVLHRIPQERLEALTAEPERGLSEAEAAERLLRFGPNRIAEQPPSSVRKLAADTARDPMIWFLVLTSGLFGAIGRTADMWVLLAAVLPLIGMDFFLHRRTEASLAGLSSVLASSAVVRRQGSEARIAAEQLVPGDIALVSAGEDNDYGHPERAAARKYWTLRCTMQGPVLYGHTRADVYYAWLIRQGFTVTKSLQIRKITPRSNDAIDTNLQARHGR